MFDLSTVKNKAIAEKVRKEAEEFMSHCHFGCQGIDKTSNDVGQAIERLKTTGLKPMAFDTEMPFVPMAKEMLPGYRIHCAVAYPMGRATLETKMRVLQKLRKMGVDDVCICLDWQAIFSQRYAAIENEAVAMVREYLNSFFRLAMVIPATLMSDTAIVETCKALDAAGVYSIKVNPGAKLGVTFEEVALIMRKFPNRFDIHPSGNIRRLSEVERYREMGCTNIHTVASLDITERFIIRQLKLYGGIE
jgi:deoxyribose-phosphate aldolase